MRKDGLRPDLGISRRRANAAGAYAPVAEPDPSAAMLAEYSAATEYTHDWADLTGWTAANVQTTQYDAAAIVALFDAYV